MLGQIIARFVLRNAPVILALGDTRENHSDTN